MVKYLVAGYELRVTRFYIFDRIYWIYLFSPPICFAHSRHRENRVFDFFILSADPR